MSQNEALQHWYNQFSLWAFSAAGPPENASSSAQETILRDQGLLEMAQTMADALLQAGYAPTQVAIAIAHGAYVTMAEMIHQMCKNIPKPLM